MADDIKSPVAAAVDPKLVEMAARPDAQKPPNMSSREWRRHRMAAGTMVVIRSHFKSIYLIPMAIISLVLGIFAVFLADSAPSQATLGMIWVAAFCFYMNLFIFEWSRAGTYALLVSIIALVLLGFAVNSEDFPVWATLKGWLASLDLVFSRQTFFFFAVFFGLCALVSIIRTQLHYVVVESNEIQIYRNALFGDRERVSMLHPRVEVRVPDMLEYFHPFYRAGQIIIHAPDRSIVLDNVLNIRRIEQITDRLGSSLAVTITRDS